MLSFAANVPTSSFVPALTVFSRRKSMLYFGPCSTCAAQKTPLQMKSRGGPKSRASSANPVQGFQNVAAPETSSIVKSGAHDSESLIKVDSDVEVEPQDSTDIDDIVEEEGSGSAGDATPHRAFKPTGRTNLQNPLEAPEESGEIDPLPASPRLQFDIHKVEKDSSLLWSWDISYDEVIEKLAVALKSDTLASVIVTNRHFITERVLYRFTSAILQAESEGAKEEGANMRKLRAEIIKVCWEYDEPLRQKLFDAEERVVTVIKAPAESNKVGEIDRACGEDSTTVNAFWIVLFASLAAWEARQVKTVKKDTNTNVEATLAEIADASRRSTTIPKYLSKALVAVGEVLTVSTPEEQEQILSSLDESAVVEMCIILEQIRHWPSNAYGPFMQKMQAIVDFAVQNYRTIAVEKLEPFRFHPIVTEPKSKLTSFKSRARGAIRI